MNLKHISIFLAVGAAALGCGPEEQPVPAVDTAIVSASSLGWQQDDKLSVFNGKGTANAMYRCTSVSGDEAVFEFVANAYPGGPSEVKDVDGAYVAVYPFSESYEADPADRTVRFNLPDSRSWKGNSTVREDNPLFGTVSGGMLSAVPVLGTVRLLLKGNVNVKSVSVSGNRPMAGPATVRMASGNPEIMMAEGSSKSLSFDFGEGQQLSEDRSTNVDVILPAGAYGSLAVTVRDVDGEAYDMSVDDVTVTAGKTVSRSRSVMKRKQIFEPWPESGMETKTYITNGIIQVGVDMSRGGCIFHLSDAANKKNVLNHYDNGRFVQQSFYGDADGSKWVGNDWRYNPVQGGGYLNAYPASIESSEVKPDSLACVSIPYHWANCVELPECRMIEVITLEGEVAHMHFTFTYDGETTHAARHQEMPAVFCNWEYSDLYYYDGASPWTGKELTHVTPANRDVTGKNEYINKNAWSERWGAFINSEGYGVGVYTPVTNLATFYRTGTGPSGARYSSCSYIAPLATFALTPGLSKTYDVYMTLGSVQEIRDRFYAIHAKL